MLGRRARSISDWFSASHAVRASALAPGVLLTGLPIFGLLNSNSPLLVRLGIGCLFLTSLIRPTNGLLLLAGLAPLGAVIGTTGGSPYSLTEPMVMAFLCGWLVREAAFPGAPLTDGARRAIIPALLLAAVVVASGTVLLSALQPFVAYPWQFVGELASFSASRYFEDPNRFAPLTSALGFLEGLGVFVSVVVLTDRRSSVAPLLARMTVIGALGVAALSLNRLMTVALRSGDLWAGLLHHLPTIRISAAFGDINAAGSYLAMALGIAIAAASVQPSWILAACPLLAALWLTSSRAAFLAMSISGVVMATITAVGRTSHARRSAFVLAAAGLMIVAATTGLLFVSESATRTNLLKTVEVRWEISRAAVRMAQEHPLFGVGIGRFLASSGAYIAPQIRNVVPRENAHNNFLQIIAELGCFGAIPFAWVLLLVGRRLCSAPRLGSCEPAVIGVLGGLLAFLLSCLAGHPLLIPEVRCAFWLVLGAAVGLTRRDSGGDPEAVRPCRRTRRLLGVIFVVLAVLGITLPFRARQAVEAVDLTDATTGFSSWALDKAGMPYRQIPARRARMYLPATGGNALLPFRLITADRNANVELALYLDGRLVNRVRLSPEGWTTVPMVVPKSAAVRFRRLDIETSGRGPESRARAGLNHESVWMGKPMLSANQPR